MNNQEQEQYSKARNRAVVLFVLISVILSFIGGYLVGGIKLVKSPESFSIGSLVNSLLIRTKAVNYQLYEDVLDLVQTKYVDRPVDEKKLFYGSVGGLVASLADPYSVFFDPEMTQRFQQEISGSFEGIGAEIGIKNEKLVIIAPLPDSPAEKAGLKASDQILKIDGVDTTGMSLDYAVSLLRGKKGTQVKLLVQSEGEKVSKDITVTRDNIKVKSVVFETKKAVDEKKSDLAYINISSFTEDTYKDFSNLINQILLLNPKGIILDLRNDPGGYLDTSISVASEFIEDGTIVTEDFKNDQKKSYEAKGEADLKNFKTVVLVNSGTASAAEIVAGALQDHEQGVIVGEKTFGKGSVQDYQEFTDGSSLKLTIAKWYTPSGKSIDGEGITPDIKVDLTDQDYNQNRDPQLDKAIELLSK
jgi:carboxyl-terminal processing protease